MTSTLAKIILFSFLFLLFIPHFTSAEYKSFIKEYNYQASEDDSRNSSRTIALREVKRLLLEELGTYLESVSEVRAFQLSKDEITILTAGIVKTEIVDEKWDGHTYWLKSKIAADSDEVIKTIDSLRKDREKSKELEEIRNRSDELLKENKRLRKELTTATGDKKQQGIAAYNQTIQDLTAIEWFEMGKALSTEKNHHTAIDAYNNAIEQNARFVKAYINRAVEYAVLGNYSQAIKDCDTAIKLDPISVSAYNNRGAFYGNLSNYVKAIEDFNRAIKLNPKDDTAYHNRGVAYDELGKFKQAINDFNRAIHLNPKSALIYYNRGLTFDKLGQHKRAIEDAKVAAQLGYEKAQEDLKKQGIDW